MSPRKNENKYSNKLHKYFLSFSIAIVCRHWRAYKSTKQMSQAQEMSAKFHIKTKT